MARPLAGLARMSLPFQPHPRLFLPAAPQGPSRSSSSSNTASSQCLSVNDLGALLSSEAAGAGKLGGGPGGGGLSACSKQANGGGCGSQAGQVPQHRGLNLAKGLGLLRSHSSSLNLHDHFQEGGNVAMFRCAAVEAGGRGQGLRVWVRCRGG